MTAKTDDEEATAKTVEKVHAGPWNGGRLTAPALAAAERKWQAGELHPDAGRLRVKDTDVRGLELRMSRTGSRSWVLSRRLDDRQRRFTIPGSAGMTLAEARTAAVQLRAATDKGGDPLAEKRAAKKAKLAAAAVLHEKPSTLAALLDRFEKDVARPGKQRSWPSRRQQIESEYRAHLGKPVADLTKAAVIQVLDGARDRGAPVAGWNGHRFLKRVLSWAVAEELIATDVTTGISAERVKGKVPPPEPRARVLSASELRAIWLALEGTASDYARIYKLILLTAQRPGEVAAMRWTDVDLSDGVWLQKTNKSDRPHSVPLSDAAVALLRAQRPDPDAGVTPLFPSVRVFNSGAGGELGPKSGNWGRFSNGIMQASGTTGWTRHDLRRTAATLMAEAKVAINITELVLNHSEAAGKGGAVASIYNRFSYEPEKRAAVAVLAERIAAIAEGTVTSEGNVVALQPAHAAAG